MKKADLIEVFGTGSAVAEFLGIERAAVSQWGDEVPELRQFQLRDKRPTIDAEIAALHSRQNRSEPRQGA